MRIDAVMLYGWEKSKKTKAPGTGFMRSIRIRCVPNPLLNAVWPLGVRSTVRGLGGVSIRSAVIGCPRGRRDSSPGRATCGDRLPDVRQQVGVTGQLLDVDAVLLPVGQASPSKRLQRKCLEGAEGS